MKFSHIFFVLSFLFRACVTSSTTPEPIPDKPQPPSPVDPSQLCESFLEDFSGQLNSCLEQNIRTSRTDFRYYTAFPSVSERNTLVMLLRIDPTDAAGIKRGPALSSVRGCYYGSYSVRMRVPNTIKAQPDLGVCVSMNLVDEDSQMGISYEVRLSSPKEVYAIYAETVDTFEPVGFNANSKFYEYGIDWSENKIVWWLRFPNNEKTIIKEEKNEKYKTPLSFSFNYYHSKLKPISGRPTSIQPPLYAYELELDYMKYIPFKNEE